MGRGECIRRGAGLPWVWTKPMEGRRCPAPPVEEEERRLLAAYPDVLAELSQARWGGIRIQLTLLA